MGKRDALLDKLLKRAGASTPLRGKARQEHERLQAEGRVHKSRRRKEVEEEAIEETAETIVAEVVAILEDDTKEDAEAVGAVVGLLIEFVEEETVDEVEGEAGEAEVMADDDEEKADDEDEDRTDKSRRRKELQLLDALITSQEELAVAQDDILGAIGALETQLKALTKQANRAPRRAPKFDAERAAQEHRSAKNGRETFFGIPLEDN